MDDQNEQEWASIFGYKPDSPEQFDELGEMYAVIRMQTEIKGAGDGGGAGSTTISR